MRTVHFPKKNTHAPLQLRWWEALSVICIVGTILIANVYALCWLPLWPAASILGATLISLFCLVVGPVKTCIVVWRIVNSRRDFEEALGAYAAYLNDNLDELSREVELLARSAAELNSKVKQIPGSSGSLRHVLFLRQSSAK